MPTEQHQKLALGLFMPNCSNMPSISTHRVVEDQWTYEHNESLALAAESCGFEYLFPVSRWRGFGGETNFLGTSLETTTWAAALLRATSSINVFSTVHIPLFHPFVVAKMGGHPLTYERQQVGAECRERLERKRVRHDGHPSRRARSSI